MSNNTDIKDIAFETNNNNVIVPNSQKSQGTLLSTINLSNTKSTTKKQVGFKSAESEKSNNT